MNKVYVNASQAISDIVREGQLIAVGGFGLCGIPAFFTPTGLGTLIAEGKAVREFDGKLFGWWYLEVRGRPSDRSQAAAKMGR